MVVMHVHYGTRMKSTRRKYILSLLLVSAVLLANACSTAPPENETIALGAPFRTFHVYAQPGTAQAFVNSWIATFGGEAQPPANGIDLTPYPSKATAIMLSSPVAALSVYDFSSGIPYPFGREVSGWGVTDVDVGIQQATAANAHVLVAPFDDPLGRDAVIQFPAGNAVQLWHLFDLPPSLYPPLTTMPDLRIYVPEHSMDQFLDSYLAFTQGESVSDNAEADGVQIGLEGKTYRRVRTTSDYGNTVVIGTDGQLPYPFGRESAGITVQSVADTVDKAKANGATVLWGPTTVPEGHSVIVQFPGAYVVEIHDGQLS
ncbi:glyoxalase [Mycolicibacterium sp. 050232]|uniref:glyoxalase n=1 Tax=Mycolicibacterium sp. 050232 TaxID=3113982 RepID=UPI002E2AB75D|nr:glyoxalase [Mycolicibacterium sp. 050232]MED5812206.1 glyoxalase [Mycolicibacterium sp. 050232]